MFISFPLIPKQKHKKIERIGALLAARGMDSIEFRMRAVHPSEWDAEVTKLVPTLGVNAHKSSAAVRAGPLIFTCTGRYLGTMAEFEDLCWRKYAVKCDLDDLRLRDIAHENYEISNKLLAERKAAAQPASSSS